MNPVHGIIVGVAMLDLLSAMPAGLPQGPRCARTRVSPVAEVHETHDDGVTDLIRLDIRVAEVLAVVV